MSFTRMLFRRILPMHGPVPMQKLNLQSIAARYYSDKAVNLSEPAVQNYLKYLMLEHDSIYLRIKKTPEDKQRMMEIKPIVEVLEQRVALFDAIESLKEMNAKEGENEAMKKMIKEEAEIYLKRLKEVDQELQNVIVEPQYTDGGVLVEVTAGAGGQEAMLFARELFEMYESYAQYKDWDYNIASLEKSDMGGIRKASMLVNGLGVPELMKVEAGVHRVQRIPATEKNGRIHTSTVSVAVLPQPTDIELDIPERDITIETKRASGAGGQHVNTTDSAVRLVHTPTGTVVECQEGRSQIKNKEIAMQKLKTLLLEKQQQEQTSKINSQRKSQIGNSNRNEKIRTYNYPQDRVTEHREGGTSVHNLKGFMEGSEALEKMQENLLRHERYQQFCDEKDRFDGKKEKKVEAAAAAESK